MILQNAIKINDVVLYSKDRHDYKSYTYKHRNKEYLFMVDGGFDYFKGAMPMLKESTMKKYGMNYLNLCLTTFHTFDEIRNKLLIPVIGADVTKKEPYVNYKFMCECDKKDLVFYKDLLKKICKSFYDDILDSINIKINIIEYHIKKCELNELVVDTENLLNKYR